MGIMLKRSRFTFFYNLLQFGILYQSKQNYQASKIIPKKKKQPIGCLFKNIK